MGKLRGTTLLVLALCASCSRTAAGTDAGTPAPNATATAAATTEPSNGPVPKWLAAAERAPILGAKARKTRLEANPKFADLPKLDGLLDDVAQRPATAAGLREAAGLLEQHADYAASSPEWAGSGTGPGAAVLHHGGMALLVDLATRACAAHEGDAAVGKAADEVPVPAWFNSGGRDQATAEQDRHVLQEAARACGARVSP